MVTRPFTPDISQRPSSVPGDTKRGPSLHRRRLLFLAYAFPPTRAPACARTWNMAKHLSRLNWDVTVVTPDPHAFANVDSDVEFQNSLQQLGIRRLLTDHRWRFLLENFNQPKLGSLAGRLGRRVTRRLGLEPSCGWLSPAFRACCELKARDVELILATGSPFGTFRLAENLAQRIGCPFVLDYRDPWTENPHQFRPDSQRTIATERRLVQQAASVLIVSPSWKETLQAQYSLGEKLQVISNGYDAEDLAKVSANHYDHFAIVYTGIFYPPKRVITPVMAALRQLASQPQAKLPRWRFHYFGPHEAHVRQEAARFQLESQIILHGEVSRKQALSAVAGADAAVIVTSVEKHSSRQENGIVTGKIFEALGLGVPILLVAPPNSDARAIIASSSHSRGFAGSEIQGIADHLRQQMTTPRSFGRPSDDRFSWQRISERLDTTLRDVLLHDPSTGRGSW